MCAEFDEQVWSKICDFIPSTVAQECSASLCFGKGLNDIRNVGDSPIFASILEGINLAGKLAYWSKLSQAVLTIAEGEGGVTPPPVLAMGLINGGSFNLNVGSYNELPQEVKDII